MLDAPPGTPCPKRAAEAGSAKDKKASSSSSSESEAGSRKRKRSSSSSSSSSSSTRKSKLRVAIQKLRADVADLAEGIVEENRVLGAALRGESKIVLSSSKIPRQAALP